MKYSELNSNQCITAYSMQAQFVIEQLTSGKTYIPSLTKSAAYDMQLAETVRLSHQQAYYWLADQFKVRKGWHPDGFFWVCFDTNNFKTANKTGCTAIIKLCIPVRQMLFFLHTAWNYILWGKRWKGRNGDAFVSTDRLTPESISTSWEAIFAQDDDHLIDLQGVVDRVEPAWVQEVIKL